MSHRNSSHFDTAAQANLSRAAKLRAYAGRIARFDNQRKQAWALKHAARIERYKNAFRGAWITRIGLGLAAIVTLLRNPPFFVKIEKRPVAPYVMGLPFGLSFGRRERSALRQSTTRHRLSPESLEQRQLLAVDITGIEDNAGYVSISEELGADFATTDVLKPTLSGSASPGADVYIDLDGDGDSDATVTAEGGTWTYEIASPLTHGQVIAASESVSFDSGDSVSISYEMSISLMEGDSIQHAINNLPADGTIRLAAGTYTGNLVIPSAKSNLRIVGPNEGVAGEAGRIQEAIVDGSIQINASGVTIDGIELRGGPAPGSNAGVYVQATNAVVQNSILQRSVEDSGTGIGIEAVITDSVSDGLVVTRNVIDGWNMGVYVQGGNNSATITNNVISNNAHAGVGADGQYQGTHFLVLTGNRFAGSGTYDVEAFGTLTYHYNSSSDISGNTFSSPSMLANGHFPVGVVSSNTVDVSAFVSIQAAINAASAGDTLQIPAGVYSETLQLSKSLNFVGAGAAETILKSDANYALTLKGPSRVDSVSIEGIGFVGSASVGVRVESIGDVGSLVIKDSRFADNKHGVNLSDGSNVENISITGSSFENNSVRDINLGTFGGNATISNVTIAGPTDPDAASKPDRALSIYGNQDVDTALGEITLTGLVVTGHYQREVVAFKGYNDMSELSITASSVTGSSATGVLVTVEPQAGTSFTPSEATASLTLDLSGLTVTRDVGTSTSIPDVGHDVFVAGFGRAAELSGTNARDLFADVSDGDSIDGDGGADTVQLEGNSEDYTVSTTGGITTATDSSVPVTVMVENVESLGFLGDDAIAVVVDDDTNHSFVVVKNGLNTDIKVDGVVVASFDNTSTQPIVLVGGGGDDTFTIDYSAGDPIPGIDITVLGGGQATTSPGDQLVITSGAATEITHAFDNANDGSVMIDGSTITYKGLEPVIDSMTATTRTFTYSDAADETISVTPSTIPGFTHRIDSTHGESVDFNLPSGKLVINGTSGADSVVIDNAILGVDVEINADSVTLNANIGGTVTGTVNTANVHVGGVVQDGVDVVANGGVVSVHAGTYTGLITIDNKDVSLVAANPSDPVILLGGLKNVVITGDSTVAIESLVFQNASIFGISVEGTSQLTLSKSVIRGTGNSGVFVDTSGSVTIDHSQVTGKSQGVLVDTGAGPVTITGSDLSGNLNYAVQNGSNTIVNARLNWWGSNVASIVAGETDGLVDFSPFLDAGVDATPAITGFVGSNSTLNVTALGAQVGGGPRIQEAIDHSDEPTLVKVHDGTYNEVVTIDHEMTLQSVNAQGALVSPTTGSKQAIVTVQASGVTISNFDFLVNQVNATAGVSMETVGSNYTDLTVNNNHFRITGAATANGAESFIGFGTDSTAIAIRNLSDNVSAPTVAITNNEILPEMAGATVDAIYDRAIFLRAANGTVSGNTIWGDSHDLAAQFVGHGTLTVSGNFFNGVGGKDTKGAQLDITEPNSHGSVAISGNTFTPYQGLVPSGSSHVRSLMIKNNRSGVPVVIDDNAFTVSEVGILVGNSNATTVTNNTFQAFSGDTSYVHLQLSNKVATGGAPGPEQMNATIQGNAFGDSGVAGGRGIEFLNHNATGATFGTITIGGEAVAANTFADGLGQFIYLDDESQADSKNSTRPNYSGPGSYGSTVMASFAADLNIEENLFGLGGTPDRASELDPVLDLQKLFALEDKIHHALDVSGLGVVTFSHGHRFVTAESGSIQRGVDAADVGNTVNVAAETFVEDVDISKSVHLLGAGPVGGTTILGAKGGSHATFDVNASNVEIEGFTITREGNNAAEWNDPTLNSAGISIQGQGFTGTFVHDNTIVGNRTAIDVNNSNGHSITNNVIINNHTGMIFRNQTDDLVVEENEIIDNRTVGILFLDASSGSNSPVQTAANSSFFNNNISGNWYGQIVDRQVGGSLPAAGTNVKNFSGNWFGTDEPIISTANSAELGYASLIPVSFGGTAEAPGSQPDVLGPGVANFDVSTYLDSGSDTDSGTYGFQGDFSVLHVITDLAQSGAIGRLSEAIALLDDSGSGGGTLLIHDGTYADDLDATTKQVTVSPGSSPGQLVIAGDVSLDINDTLSIELDGTDPVTEFDNLVVTGTVTLGGAALNLSRGFAPLPNDSFILINNDASDPIIGTFNGLAEGSVVMVSGLPMTISYMGGVDSNDVVLTIAQPTDVWVNDTWSEQSNDSGGTAVFVESGDVVQGDGLDDEAISGKTFGYNAFATLQEAVDAVAEGGTVHVLNGTYDEVVTINRSMTFESVTALGATIAPTVGSHQSVISIDAKNVTVSGFVIQVNQNDDALSSGTAPIAPIGISAVNSEFDGLLITNNKITSIGDNASVNWTGSPSLSVRGAGIVLHGPSGPSTHESVTISNNMVDVTSGSSFFQRAVWLSEVNGQITGNTLSGAANDLIFQFASGGTSLIDGNLFLGAHIAGGGGLEIADPNGDSTITVANNTFAPAAVEVSPGSGTYVPSTSLVINRNVSNSEIVVEDNSFTGHATGIDLGGAQGVTIRNNDFYATATHVSVTHVVVDSQSKSSNGSTAIDIDTVIQGNEFHSHLGVTTTSVLIEDDLVGSSFAGLEIGGISNQNVYLDSQLGDIAISVTGGIVSINESITSVGNPIHISGGKATISGSSIFDAATAITVTGTGELEVGSGNVISDGTTGLLLDGADVLLAGDSLNDLVLTGQTGNYITLANGAYDDSEIDGTGITLDGVAVSGMTHSDLADVEAKITDVIDNDGVGLVRLQANVIVVTPVQTPTASDNDYTRIKNAIEAANDGDTIVLGKNTVGSSVFNWTESNAMNSWAAGNNGTTGEGDFTDDYHIALPSGLNNVTVTAAIADGITIQGPGDLSTVNLEGVFFASGNGTNTNWTFSNFKILDFDNAILFDYAGDDFSDLTVDNMHIRTASDSSADAFQNIAIHYASGTNISITNNLFELVGNGDGTSYAIQSNSHGGANYNGLNITGNTINVLNAGDEKIYGIWENGHAHASAITVSGNTFTGNAGNTDVQTAFRITSHSGASTTVEYFGNTVSNADVAFKWLDVYGSGSVVQDYSNGTNAILITNNTVTSSGVAVDIGGIEAKAALTGNNFDGAVDNATDVRISSNTGTVTIGGGNAFAGDGYFIENLSPQAINLVGTTSTFDESDNFDIEDKMYHAPDTAASGLIRVVAGELFVTTPGTGLADETIQRAIDAASAGDTVNVEAGLYVEQVLIGKDLSLVGQGAGTVVESPTTLSSSFVHSGTKHAVLSILSDSDVSVSSLTVNGAGNGETVGSDFVGIGVYNSSASIDSVTLQGIRDTPLNGIQRGRAIFVGNDTGTHAVSITNSTISDYQKNGIDIRESGGSLSATITGNTITGAGATTLIAQNGIVLLGGVDGLISGNAISGHDYTPNDADSTGVLLYANGNAGVSVDNNSLSGNKAGVYVFNSDATIDANTITGAPANSTGVLVDGGTVSVTNHTTLAGNDIGILVANGSASVSGNTLTANAVGFAIGENGSLTISSGNSIDGGTTGVLLDGPTATLTGDALGDLSVGGQTGNYITLANGAYDDSEIDGTGITLDGVAVSGMTHSDLADVEAKITDVIDNDGVGLVRLQANVIVVTPVQTPTASDNDYTRIKNAIEAANDGDTIVLGKNTVGSSVFNWTESNAMNSWAAGNNGTTGEGDFTDDYHIALPSGLNNVTVTAAIADGITIQGPGDLSTVNLEGVFFASGNGTNTNWTFSNFKILDFDNAILFDYAGDDFSDLTVDNMHIRTASDSSADAFQNIAIHYASGTNISITNNLFELVGNGDGTSYAIQSNSHGGANYNGLNITGNTINVLNAGDEKIYGIWENGHAHASAITVSGNTFTGNAGNTDVQTAFRITSHSGASTTVEYFGNTVSNADVAFKWLDVYGSGSVVQDYSNGTNAILITNNTVTSSGVAVDIGGIEAKAALTGNNFDGAVDNATDVRISSNTGTVTIGGGNAFAGDGYFIENLSPQAINLVGTTSTFDESDNFDIEDKMYHAPDTAASGLIRVVAGELFVTTPGTGLADETIQRAIDAASAGDTVNVETGLYVEQVLIGKDIDILGDASGGTTVKPTSGTAFRVLGSGSFGDADNVVSLNYINLDGAGAATRGVFVEGSAALGTFSMSNADVTGFTINGVYIDAYSTSGSGAPNVAAEIGAVELSDLDFTNNGTAGGSGSADIQFYGFNTDATLTNLTMVGASVGTAGVQSGIQFRGVGESSGVGISPMGTVTLTGIDISGDYRTQMIGVQRYSDVSSLFFSGVALGGAGSEITGNWGASLRFDAVGTGTVASPALLDLGTTTFRGLDASSTQRHEIELAPDNGFSFLRVDGTDTIWNVGGTDIAASALDLTQAFAVEDRILHYVDKLNPSHGTFYKGFVDIQVDAAFVTEAIDNDEVGNGSIQRGVDIVNVGGIVNVSEGTFVESVLISKAVTVDGQGVDTIVDANGNNGFSISANNVLVSDLRVTNADDAFEFVGTSNGVSLDNVQADASGRGVHIQGAATNLTLDSVVLTANTTGLRVATLGNASGLTILGSEFDGNDYGVTVYASDSLTDNQTNFDNILIRNSSFNNNSVKGIYFEKLNNATFENVTVDASGTSGGFGAGVDINLKYGTYTNIDIVGGLIADSGTGDTTNGVGLTIKARGTGTDASYAGNPASLTNVSIVGTTIDGNQNGVRIGEPGKDNLSPTAVLLDGVIISDSVGIGLDVVGGNVTLVNSDVTSSITNNAGVRVVGSGQVVVTNSQVTGSVSGVHVDGGTAVVQGVNLTGNSIGVLIQNDGVADLGDVIANRDITGLGSSSGGNNFTGYTSSSASTGAIVNLNADTVSGSQGAPPDVPAIGNTFDPSLTTPALIESAIYHDVDDNDLGFVQTSTIVTVIATVAVASEPDNDGEFTVDLGAVNNTGNPIVVFFTVTGTASNGVDYDTITSSVSILDGDQTATIDVSVIDEALVENSETVVVTLTGTDNAVVGIDATPAVVTIDDDDHATWSLDASSSSVAEGHNVSYTFSLTGSIEDGETVTVDIDLTDVSATYGSDYGLAVSALREAIEAWNTANSDSGANGVLSSDYDDGSPDPFVLIYTAGPGVDGGSGTPGYSSMVAPLILDLTATNDTLVEGDEVVTVSISNPGGSTASVINDNDGDAPGVSDGAKLITTTIIDNDEADVAFTISNQTIGESSPATITVVLNMVGTATELQRSVTVNIADLMSGTAVDPADFGLSATNITFEAGSLDGATKSITLTPVNDGIIEADETIVLQLSSIVDDLDGSVSIGATAEHTVTIQDDETATWSLMASTGRIGESDAGGVTYTFALSGVVEAGETVTVDIQLTDISATYGADYDNAVSALEIAILEWNNANSPDSGTLSYDYTPGPDPFTLIYTAGDGGVGGPGYSSMPALVLNVQVTDDSLVEGDESVTVAISDASGSVTGVTITDDDGTIDGTKIVETTIEDNDTLTWAISPIATSVEEGNNALYTISLTGSGIPEAVLQANETASVTLSIGDVDGDTDSADYASFVSAVNAAISGRPELSFDGSVLTFTGTGSALADILVSLEISDDTVVEGDEEFEITLSSPNGSTVTVGSPDTNQILLGSDDQVITTITDDDIAEANVSATIASATEGGATGTLTFNLIDPSNGDAPVTVNVDTVVTFRVPLSASLDGLSVDDFELTYNSLTLSGDTLVDPGYAVYSFTISSGVPSVNVAVTALNNQDGFGRQWVEGIETLTADLVSLTLASGDAVTLGYTLAAGADDASISISDDDTAEINVNSSVDNTATEDASASNATATLTFALSDSNASDTEVSVDVDTKVTFRIPVVTGEGLTADDFSLTYGTDVLIADLGTPGYAIYTFTIPAGAQSTAVTVTALDNTVSGSDLRQIVEGTETLTTDLVDLELETGDAVTNGYSLAVDASDAEVTMSDDDQVVVGIVATDPVATEASTTTGTFTVDFQDGDGNLVVADIATKVTFSIPIVTTVNGLTVGDFDLSLASGAPSGSVLTVDDSNPGNRVYTLTVPTGFSAVDLDATPNNDNIIEANEDINATVGAITVETASATRTHDLNIATDNRVDASVTIVSDDTALLRLLGTGKTEGASLGAADGFEWGTAPGTFVVQLVDGSGNPIASEQDVFVTFQALGSGTASNATQGVDYGFPGGLLVIPAGETQASISVLIVDDSNAEGTETVKFQLNSLPLNPFAGSLTLGSLADRQDTIELFDNDVAPVAMDDFTSIVEGGTVTPVDSVLSNDSDADVIENALADEIQVFRVQGSSGNVGVPAATVNGSVTMNSDGTFSYTHDGSNTASDSFSYTVRDSAGKLATAVVNITITNANDAPVAENDAVTTGENTAVSVDVLANDSDEDDTVLTVSLGAVTVTGIGAGALNAGSLTVNPTTQTIEFDPSTDFDELQVGETATVTVTYTVSDDELATDTAVLTITITGTNDGPVAVADGPYSVNEGDLLTVSSGVGLGGNDVDVDSDVLTYVPLTHPTHGMLQLNADGSFTYQHNGSEATTDSFAYRVIDNNGGFATAVVTINIDPVNDAPILDLIGNHAIDEGLELTFNASAFDLDGDILSYSLVGAPATATIDSSGNFSWTPSEADGPGTYTFSVVVADGNGGTDSEVITVTVGEVNVAPETGGIVTLPSMSEDSGSVLITSGALVETASDDDLPAQALVAHNLALVAPANGTLVNNGGGVWTFTPATDFFGTVNFTFDVTDGLVTTGGGTAELVVTPVNDAPVAKDFVSPLPALMEDTTTTGLNFGSLPSELVEDVDDALSVFEADHFTMTGVSIGGGPTLNPAAAGITVDGTGNITIDTTVAAYQSLSAGDTVNVVVTLEVADAAGLTDIGSVTFQVTGANDDPMAVDDAALLTAEDTPLTISAASLLANDADVDEDALSISSVIADNGATASIVAGNVVVTPATNFTGDITLTYTISDGNGGTGTATVIVSVTPVNDLPVAEEDTISTLEDTTFPASGTFNVLSNDFDAEGPLTVTRVNGNAANVGVATGTVAGGLITIQSTGGLTYVPKPNFSGVDQVTYRVTDSEGLTSQAIIYITVMPVNDVPVANAQSVSTTQGTPVAIVLSGSDVDGDSLTYSNVSIPTSGTLSGSAPNLTYTPNPGFNGADSFTFTVNDGAVDSAVETVTIQVDAVNQAPVFVNQTMSGLVENVAIGTPVGVVAATDPELGALTYVIIAGNDSGDFEINSSTGEITTSGVINYEEISSYDLTVKVTDNGSPNESTTATVTISVGDLVEEGPTINAIRVNSTAWSDLFRDYIDFDESEPATTFSAHRFDDGANAGYEVPFGGTQTDTLPWINLNQILIDFDRPVVGVDISDFILSGTAGVNADFTTGTIPTIIQVNYDATNRRAILTLNQSVQAASLDLRIVAEGIRDASGNPLDGEWSNGVTTGESGDGESGGDFQFRLNVLPGDVYKSGSNFVDDDDETAILQSPAQNKNLFDAITFKGALNGYDGFFDVDGSGVVNNDDTRAVQRRMVSYLTAASSSSLFVTSPEASNGSSDESLNDMALADFETNKFVSLPSKLVGANSGSTPEPFNATEGDAELFSSERSLGDYVAAVDEVLGSEIAK
ncbi:tandem-95 repeat protein [Rubripirellula amarantea]|nr:tandem-95 repeat protein [Rubripirellula amarantea]